MPAAVLTVTLWDEAAETFDEEPDHGLRDPVVRGAWAELLLPLIPARSTVVDVGCGTGSLAVLLAQAGHEVRGVDASPRMLAAAKRKARKESVSVDLTLGDAAEPPYAPGSADVVLARHVLWALPNPTDAVARWCRLLKPDGRLVLVEGHWSTGAGLTAQECQDVVMTTREEATVHLLDDPTLWGHPIADERYLLVSRH